MGSLVLILTVLVVRQFMFEAFVTPTNAMAPAILGRHWEGTCPRCGSPAYATPDPSAVNGPVLMICGKERRSCKVPAPPRAELSGDRFVVNKMVAPHRWDVIAFRYPEDPKIIYCFRLVGLPGETITIKDGAVWADGKKQTPPDSCKGLEYLDQIDGWQNVLWGSGPKPAKLASDEYFVLGDFSAKSKDSRLWQQGAPGHPPYAVPGSYIIGVVTHIYWPPGRWAILR